LRYKVAIRFAIDGDLRFISHHDMMRLFERALSRAQLPVRFSEGFNPRPRLSLPLPRAVGVASEADVLVVELEEPTGPPAAMCGDGEPLEPDVFRDRLAGQMPSGLTLMDAWFLDARRTLQAERVVYEVGLPSDCISAVADALERLLASPDWFVERRRAEGGPARRIDLRAHLLEARLERAVLRWTVHAGNDGSIRPAELLAAVGLSPSAIHHRVRRISVQWAGHPDGVPNRDTLRLGDPAARPREPALTSD
jgi:radical SAM-linked protein